MKIKTANTPATVVALLTALLLAACGDDKDAVDPATPTATGPSASAAPPSLLNVEAIEAARTYIQETGIEDRKGELTEPLNCPEITEDTDGEFCIHQAASIYAAGLVILVVGDAEGPSETAWEVRLAPSGSGWRVIGVTPYGSTE